MEKIIFTKSGPIDKFIEWVDRFKGEISKDSLIIEIDTTQKLFISKTYAQDRSLVRNSQISFADSNLVIQNETLPESMATKRVLVGIFMILPKFIEALKTVATSDKFKMEIDADEMDVAGETNWCAKSVTFKSQKSTIKMPGSSLNAVEMTPLPDAVFANKIWVAPEPVSIRLSGEELSNLLCISNIFAFADKMKNFMEFYTESNAEGKKILKVRDPEQGSYDYELGVLDGPTNFQDFAFAIYRERFLLAVKNALTDTTLTISSTLANRVLIEMADGNTKTIIARVVR